MSKLICKSLISNYWYGNWVTYMDMCTYLQEIWYLKGMHFQQKVCQIFSIKMFLCQNGKKLAVCTVILIKTQKLVGSGFIFRCFFLISFLSCIELHYLRWKLDILLVNGKLWLFLLWKILPIVRQFSTNISTGFYIRTLGRVRWPVLQ